MVTPTRVLLVVHSVLLVLGGVGLWRSAVPLEWDGGLSSLSSIDWPFVVVPVLLVALVAGALEGVLLRFGQRLLVVVMAVLAAYPAYVWAGLMTGRWFPEEVRYPQDPSGLVAALVGWLAFLAASVAVALAIAAIWATRSRTSPTLEA